MRGIPRRPAPLLIVSALLLSAIGLPLQAQAPTRGAVGGTVTEPSGGPVAQAVLRLTELATGFETTAETDLDGRFSVDLLRAGSYQLAVEQIGFRPLQVTDLSIRPDRAVSLDLVLRPAQPPFDSIDVQSAASERESFVGSGTSTWIPGELLSALPENRQKEGSITRLSSRFGAEASAVGLPSWFGRTAIDGIVASREALPHPAPSLHRGLFPRDAVLAANLVVDPSDTEWADGSGPVVQLLTRPGSERFAVDASGFWSGTPFSIAPSVVGTENDYTSAQAALTASGPLSPSARFLVGAEILRLATPFSGDPLTRDQSELIPLIEESREAPPADEIAGLDAANLFGRLDWQASNRVDVEGWINVSRLQDAQPYGEAPWVLTYRPRSEGTDILAGLTIATRFSSRLSQEVRAGFSRRGAEIVASDAAAFSATSLDPFGVQIGAPSQGPEQANETGLTIQQTLRYRAEGRSLKGGFFAEYRSYEFAYPEFGAREFVFSGPDAFAARQGWLRQFSPATTSSSFSIPTVGAHLQGALELGSDLEVAVGARVSLERMPLGDAAPDTAFLQISGLQAASEARLDQRVSPRISFDWLPGEDDRWSIRGSAGLYHDPVEPLHLDPLLRLGSIPSSSAGLGTFTEWPDAPGAAEFPSVGTGVRLATPDYAGPRSIRGSLSISRLLGDRTLLSADLLYRNTALLTRVRDVNLPIEALAADQFGRQVFGQLEQQGDLIAAAPSSNRRFIGYDQVLAFEANGTSRYLGATLGLEQQLGPDARVIASYTYSTTEDDAFLANMGLTPLPVGLDWGDGPSDFDVPHQAAIFGELTVPGLPGPRLAAVYRYRSGDPFTPRFARGVDVNADGFPGNEPAFVSAGISGTDALVSSWDCLQEQLGAFAARNSCRTSGVHSLDLRLAIGGLAFGDLTAELMLDLLHLVHSDVGRVDDALYLVDPNDSIAVDEEAATVTLPLVANEGFGELLTRQTPGRMLRLGLQIRY